MSLLSNLKKYPDVDIEILKGYLPHDKQAIVNDGDRDLVPIRIKLPDPPESHLIANFGLPVKKQKWHAPRIPRRLDELQRRRGMDTIDEIWEYLEKNKEYYVNEIKFIKKQWYYRLNGYWFYNNGKPTYMTGQHYFYCGWWKIDIGLPAYRDRDRRWFIFSNFIYNETRTFKNIAADGNAVPGKNGSYAFEDTGNKLFLGFNYPKHRREGATYRAECINYEIISRTKSAHGGIQSMNEKSSKKAYRKHLVAPFKKLPFFFKPNYEGSTDPKSELSFNPPAERLSSKGSKAMSAIGLESMINYEVADKSAYDGDKLIFHHDDEVGKLKDHSCWERHMIVKECLVLGDEIVGFTIKTSTVGEMEKGGGKRFQKQCEMSDFYWRDENGQTVSWLANLFLPAYDGLQGYIDEYGYSVIENPTSEQKRFIGKKIGAKEYILRRRRAFIEKGDFESLSEYIRLYPTTFRECFRTMAKSSGFNLRKLEERIDELRFDKTSGIRTGDFQWVNGKRDTMVEFVDKPNGKFKISHLLNPGEHNKQQYDKFEETYIPMNTIFGVAGGDPFKFNKTEGNRKSNGGGAVVRKGKLNIKDGEMTLKRKFVCTYSNRTYDKYEYAEDMLMMCIYYGVKMFPEINVDLLWDYFENRGYRGYLLHQYDPKLMVSRKTPGLNLMEKVKQDIFSEYMTWIEHESDEETHTELLEECRDIDGPEDMTNYDLFTAGGFALLGTNPIYDEVEQITSGTREVTNYHRKIKYKLN